MSGDGFPRDGPIADHKPLILKTVRRYFRRFRGAVPWDDLVSSALLIATQALRAWKPEKATFGTYLHWRLLELVRVGEAYRYEEDRLASSPREERNEARRDYNRRHLLSTTGTIDPKHHRRGLRVLSRRKLHLGERAVLDWLLEPNGTQADLAERLDVSETWVSATKYRLLTAASQTSAARYCQRHIDERAAALAAEDEDNSPLLPRGLLWRIMDEMRESGDYGKSYLIKAKNTEG